MSGFGTISLCMIVKNEEAVLGRCLESVQGIADEIIIVDTGSTDATREIARQYTQKVYDFPWIDDFSAARNTSFDKAVMNYVMWLDADDVLLEKDKSKLQELKKALNPSIHTVMMRYDLGADPNGAPLLSYYRERLLLRSMNPRWAGAVHEAIVPQGNIIYSDIAVTHKKERPADPDRNLRIFERQIAEGKPLVPRERFYYARELMYHDRIAEAAEEFQGFLDSEQGWQENCIMACRDLAFCLNRQQRETDALCTLFQSFIYDTPRAELCCDIGDQFLRKNRPEVAVYWYERALSCEKKEHSGAFVCPECYGYYPSIQLCVCWDRLGDREQAVRWNERAGEYKPGDPSVAYNRRYFSGKEGS